MKRHKPLIAALCGSIRSGSRTRSLAQFALDHFTTRGCETLMLDPRELDLPFCSGLEVYEHPGVAFLKASIRKADAILLVTPEYHGSLSGVLKNALDLCEENDFKGKVVAVIAVSGGVHSHNALNAISQICRHLHAWVIPYPIAIAFSGQVFSETGEILSDDILKRLEVLVEETLSAVKRFK